MKSFASNKRLNSENHNKMFVRIKKEGWIKLKIWKLETFLNLENSCRRQSIAQKLVIISQCKRKRRSYKTQLLKECDCMRKRIQLWYLMLLIVMSKSILLAKESNLGMVGKQKY